MGRSVQPNLRSVIVTDRSIKSGSYLFQIEFYDNTFHLVIAYYNVNSLLPIIHTPGILNASINSGEQSYIGGRLSINNESYTVFHIEPCDEGDIYLTEFCAYVFTKDRVIVGTRNAEYGPMLCTADKDGFNPDDDHDTAFSMEPLSRSFGDALVTITMDSLTIALPDDYVLVFYLDGEFSGYQKIDTNKMMSEGLLGLETCQAIRSWLDSIL